MQITTAWYQKVAAAFMIAFLTGLTVYLTFDMRVRGLALETIHYAGLLIVAFICLVMTPNFVFSFRVDNEGLELIPLPFVRHVVAWDEINSYKVEPVYMYGVNVFWMTFSLKHSNRRVQVRFPSMPDADQSHRLQEMFSFAARRIDGGANNLYNDL